MGLGHEGFQGLNFYWHLGGAPQIHDSSKFNFLSVFFYIMETV